MKKFSIFAHAIQTSVLSFALLLSACLIGFTSCSDDDDENNGGIVGTWQSVHVDTWEEIDGVLSEDGAYSGPYTGATAVFTADGKYILKEDGETETATYKLTGNKLILEADGDTSEAKVLELSNNKLILEFVEIDTGYKYYEKAEFKRVK